MRTTTLQGECIKEQHDVKCKYMERQARKSESQLGFEHTTVLDLVGCSNHWATGDYMVSKGKIVGLDWNHIVGLHSQVMTGTCELTNSKALSD